ncbi:MAG: helical backbone metal receptor [Myxococcota bacterium]|nr:helical backbone metal receptor [Myxococcota bacterium]MDW8361184.1 helical backbone metal receptor [Myxococcales bacterium]
MGCVEAIDALGHRVRLARPARRVVSLVPSETLSVCTIAGVERLVGRTRYCVEPADALGSVPVVGGTKDVDVDAVLALEPDLVLANQEENTRRVVEALRARGIAVHVSFPCSVAASNAYLESLGRLLGADVTAYRASVEPTPIRARAFVPIWRDPWMTFDGRTFADDVLRAAGIANAFADRARRYPLSADLGHAPAVDPGERDTRYPRITLDEVVARAPDLVLLPDEPYAFGPSDVAELRALDVPAARAGRVLTVCGADLFWYGVRTRAGIERLRALLDVLPAPDR